MTRIELAPEVLDDFDRFFEHIAQYDPESAPDRIGAILEALQILAHSPQIGRPVQGGKREGDDLTLRFSDTLYGVSFERANRGA